MTAMIMSCLLGYGHVSEKLFSYRLFEGKEGLRECDILASLLLGPSCGANPAFERGEVEDGWAFCEEVMPHFAIR
jgi:hypothetical protein